MKILVKSAKHVKDGEGAKGPWSLYTFEGSDGKRYSTFWARIVNFIGQEIVGDVTVTETERDGKKYVNRSFRPDPAWEKDVKPSLVRGSAILPPPAPVPSHNEIVTWARDQAGRGVNCLVQSGIVKDVATYALVFDEILSKVVQAVKDNYNHPDSFAPNPPAPTPKKNTMTMDEAIAEGTTVFEGKVIETGE